MQWHRTYFHHFVKGSEGDMISSDDRAWSETQRQRGKGSTSEGYICNGTKQNSWKREKQMRDTCVLSAFAAFNRRTTSPCSFTRISNISFDVSSAIASTTRSIGVRFRSFRSSTHYFIANKSRFTARTRDFNRGAFRTNWEGLDRRLDSLESCF